MNPYERTFYVHICQAWPQGLGIFFLVSTYNYEEYFNSNQTEDDKPL